MSSAFTKSGVSGTTGPSSPLNVTCLAPGLNAGLVEHGLQRHAAPVGVAHRAVGKLPARDARLEEAAAVARALVHRDDLDRLESVLRSQATGLSGVSPCL